MARQLRKAATGGRGCCRIGQRRGPGVLPPSGAGTSSPAEAGGEAESKAEGGSKLRVGQG